MIGQIRGRVVSRQAPTVLIDAGGVGYEVTLTTAALHRIRAIGEEVVFATHFVVREDHMALFGFADSAERDLFRELIRVSGIGPKVAMVILSGMNADELVSLVASGRVDALTRLPGIGKKTAERLIVELRDRLADRAGGSGSGADSAANGSPATEAEAALVALGYKPVEATRMVKTSMAEGEESVEGVIRSALRKRMRG